MRGVLVLLGLLQQAFSGLAGGHFFCPLFETLSFV